MTRACVSRAATVIVDGRDDDETSAIALAVDHTNPDVHIVAALRKMNRREQLRYVHPRIQSVQWHMPKLVSEEALDPGITQVYADLMSSGGGGNTYSVRLPEALSGRTFGECQTHFGRTFGATVIAVGSEPSGGGAREVVVGPRWDAAVEPGATCTTSPNGGSTVARAAQARGPGQANGEGVREPLRHGLLAPRLLQRNRLPGPVYDPCDRARRAPDPAAGDRRCLVREFERARRRRPEGVGGALLGCQGLSDRAAALRVARGCCRICSAGNRSRPADGSSLPSRCASGSGSTGCGASGAARHRTGVRGRAVSRRTARATTCG